MPLVQPVKSLGSAGRVIVARIPEGHMVHEALGELLRAQDIGFAVITGIGGLRKARIGYFKPGDAEYCVETVEARDGYTLELAALSGNVFRHGDNYNIHLHAVIGIRPGNVRAGHLVEAEAWPFVEVQLIEVLGVDSERVYSARLQVSPRFRECG